MNTQKRALIVGLGISGMAAAVSLHKQGWQIVIIERAKARRTGGYFIGVHTAGREAAEALGIWQNVHQRTPTVSSNWEILQDGSRMRVAGFADALTRPATLLRGDVENGLWQTLSTLDGVDVRFDSMPVSLQNQDNSVLCRLKTAGVESDEMFDLVIGADGMRSSVRKLAFGDDSRFLKPLGAIICAFQLKKTPEHFRFKDGVIVTEPKRSLFVFPLEDCLPTALFSYACTDTDSQFAAPPLQTLRQAFDGMPNGEIIDEMLDELANADNFLFDSVNQVKMESWINGRIVLLGDAAWCLTLYSGLGATAGIKGAYELGQALGRHADIDNALAQWQKPYARGLSAGKNWSRLNAICSCRKAPLVPSSAA
ncbi:3-hydroxybenzoate 6-hydroxylase [Kingella potus]|uniref:3-hydroxybenzoate 6-hydroxylase n=1 Tax=Kingella potus TaxID=265175 RepID=A0A377R4M7_9NEIS|nr:FAD-dependent monooxygenase [Kingella potus]UOP00427.1 FAD-dependent monooxygenase [Kingella potus]STR02505.1 3-hydroxybenzoate 6-hydroxylase [Kingella potus]